MADVNYLSNQLEGVSVQDENYDTNAPPVPIKAKVCAGGVDLYVCNC
jgi:hypothetical protein